MINLMNSFASRLFDTVAKCNEEFIEVKHFTRFTNAGLSYVIAELV